MAVTWVDERGGYRAAPLIDALDRGSPPRAGRCLEIGSGTGVLTAYLHEVWDDLVSVDLSMKMMLRQRTGRQVQADASALPFPESTFAVVVIGDAPLFANEVVRLLASDGAVIWSNALGRGAPYYVPTVDLLDALIDAAPDSQWSAVESQALWGSWVMFHRAEVAGR